MFHGGKPFSGPRKADEGTSGKSENQIRQPQTEPEGEGRGNVTELRRKQG